MPSNKDPTRINCKEAADMIGCSVQTIKQGLITGTLPIGSAVPPKDDFSHWTFVIPRKAVEHYIAGEMAKLLLPDWIKHQVKMEMAGYTI